MEKCLDLAAEMGFDGFPIRPGDRADARLADAVHHLVAPPLVEGDAGLNAVEGGLIAECLLRLEHEIRGFLAGE